MNKDRKTKSPPTLAAQLKARREQLGWTYYRLGKESGTKPSLVARIEETGKARLDVLERLADTMDCKIVLVANGRKAAP